MRSSSRVHFGSYTFLLYGRDMKSAVTDCNLRLYADDTCLLFSNENVSSIEKHVNADFNSFCEWLIDNKLSIYLGEDKTKCILFKKGFIIYFYALILICLNLWLFVTTHENLSLFKIIHENLSLFMIIYENLSLFMIIHENFSFMKIFWILFICENCFKFFILFFIFMKISQRMNAII